MVKSAIHPPSLTYTRWSCCTCISHPPSLTYISTTRLETNVLRKGLRSQRDWALFIVVAISCVDIDITISCVDIGLAMSCLDRVIAMSCLLILLKRAMSCLVILFSPHGDDETLECVMSIWRLRHVSSYTRHCNVFSPYGDTTLCHTPLTCALLSHSLDLRTPVLVSIMQHVHVCSCILGNGGAVDGGAVDGGALDGGALDGAVVLGALPRWLHTRVHCEHSSALPRWLHT